MTNSSVLEKINKDVFTRKDIKKAIGISNKRGNNVRNVMESFLLNDVIIRTGRDRYIKKSDLNNKIFYSGIVSEDTRKIIDEISKKYPYVKFQVWELRSLNEFVNHLIAKNSIYIDVENDGCEFVYGFLKEKYNKRLLLKPDKKELMYYLSNNDIIINKLVSEVPQNNEDIHVATLEKIIVDIFVDKIFESTVSKEDYKNLLERAFSKYLINQRKLFRYARRRNKEKELKDFINEKTNIELAEEE